MRFRLIALAAAAASVSACATETVPACRAPAAHEMTAFQAVVSHNSAALTQAMAPGALRNALAAGDPAVRAHVWGNQGVTQGTVVGMLSRPPLCVFDDPAMPPGDAIRQIIVYPQYRYDQIAPAPETPLAEAPSLPYGIPRRDFMTCRFEQTAAGWKLADLCGYSRPVADYTTG